MPRTSKKNTTTDIFRKSAPKSKLAAARKRKEAVVKKASRKLVGKATTKAAKKAVGGIGLLAGILAWKATKKTTKAGIRSVKAADRIAQKFNPFGR